MQRSRRGASRADITGANKALNQLVASRPPVSAGVMQE